MRDTITNIIMRSIMQKADSENDGTILSINLESLSSIAEYATDEIVEFMDMKAQEQWDGEYTLAHV